MDRIEPIPPTPPAIAPIDATHVKVRAVKRESQAEAESREEARRREEARLRAGGGTDEEPPDDQPHVDLRV